MRLGFRLASDLVDAALLWAIYPDMLLLPAMVTDAGLWAASVGLSSGGWCRSSSSSCSFAVVVVVVDVVGVVVAVVVVVVVAVTLSKSLPVAPMNPPRTGFLSLFGCLHIHAM